MTTTLAFAFVLFPWVPQRTTVAPEPQVTAEPEAAPADWATHIAVAAHGSRAAIASKSGRVQLLDPLAPEDHEARRELVPQLVAEPWALAFSPSGHRLAALDDDGGLVLWRLDAMSGESGVRANLLPVRKPKTELRGYDFGATLLWSPDGERLACGDSRGRARLLDADGYLLESWPIGSVFGSPNLVWSPDGARLWTAGDQRVEARSGATGLLFESGPHAPLVCGGTVHSIAHHPSRPILATGVGASKLIVWDLETRQPLFEYATADGPFGSHRVAALAWSPDGSRLALTTVEGAWVEVFELATRKLVSKSDWIGAHFSEPLRIVWSPDADRVWYAWSCGGGQVSSHLLRADAPEVPDDFRGPLPEFGHGVGLALLRDGGAHCVVRVYPPPSSGQRDEENLLGEGDEEPSDASPR